MIACYWKQWERSIKQPACVPQWVTDMLSRTALSIARCLASWVPGHQVWLTPLPSHRDNQRHPPNLCLPFWYTIWPIELVWQVIFVCLFRNIFPNDRGVGQLWTTGTTDPMACFCVALKIRMVFIFFKNWEEEEERQQQSLHVVCKV